MGIIPVEDNMGVGLGFGFSIDQNKGMLSLGAVYQKVDSLAEGQMVGQELSSVNDLIVESDYKSGVYLGYNYAFEIN